MRRLLLALSLALILTPLVGTTPIGAQETVYTDTMDSADGGLLSTDTFDPSISFAYQNGSFVVSVAQPSYAGDITSTLSVPELASSRLTVDAFIAGDQANKYVFAGCRHTDAGEGYFFGYLPATGDVLIWRRDASGDTNIAQSVEPSLIAPAGSAVQIGIDCQANVITGMVGGQPVSSAVDGTYAMGRPAIGIGANGRQTDGLTVAFDNLTVTDNGNLVLGSETPAVPVLPVMQSAGATATVFDQSRQTATQNPALLAGMSGTFVEESNTYTFASAGVNVADFFSVVTFTNPDDLSAPFDVGFEFRTDQAAGSGWRLTVVSDGSWYLQQPGQTPIASGVVSSFDPNPGSSNVIELFVQGSSGLSAINGEVLPLLDLSLVSNRGDVSVGAGFYQGDTVVGRSIAYTDWWLFPVDPLDIPSG